MRLDRYWNSKWEISEKCVRERCRSISERKRREEAGESAGPPDPKALCFSALWSCLWFLLSYNKAGKLRNVLKKKSCVKF